MPQQGHTHMSLEERETRSLGLAQGYSLRMMARVLGRAPSTVSRESARNARGHPYRACTAQHLAATRARQPRRIRKLLDPWLWQYVRTHLGQGCSPEQGALRSELLTSLRQARKARRPRSRGTARLVILARMEGTDAGSVRAGFTRTLRHVPAPLRKTLTYDQGKEMAEHERLAQRLAIQIFFVDPHCSWQRGTNENTNGLLRQYLGVLKNHVQHFGETMVPGNHLHAGEACSTHDAPYAVRDGPHPGGDGQGGASFGLDAVARTSSTWLDAPADASRPGPP
ncbi:MAG: IS30 family transposase, partial [Nitrospirales bacterium]